MLEGFLLVLALITSAGLLLMAWGAFTAHYDTKITFLPSVDIIIAARNEEQRIEACLESISRLTYPKQLLHVVVVDDRSTDATPSIIAGFASRYPWISLLKATPETGQLRGKTNAVTQGIEATHGEIILFTDADCEIPPGWVENTVKYYNEENVGVVGGFTSLAGRSGFREMQALDWFFLFSAAAGLVRIGFPVTAVGTNLSVRRSAYLSVGGYRTIPFSVTEDYALFHAITHGGIYRARIPREPATLTVSYPCDSWDELYLQKKRWFAGGKGMSLGTIGLFAIPYLLNVVLLVGLVTDPAAIVLPLVMKVVSELLVVFPSLITFRRLSLLRSFLFFEVYFFIYVLVYPPMVLLTDAVIWKERGYGGAPEAENTNAPSV